MTTDLSQEDADVKIETLLAEFYDAETGFEDLGRCKAASDLPSPYNELLNHNEHMTVTVESHHGESVDVVVHRYHRTKNVDGDWYSREITLKTSKSGKVVQYGIVRLNIQTLDPEVWRQIESRTIPLGRVLIEHNVLREVQLCGLWEITAGPALASLLDASEGQTLYGRTALIYCDGEPAIELLEVVAP
ncbi:hypothetical protein [Roseiconus lacunae]|uniref:hypothetical protein n=1 Tax=Roseiconus lacunae TaxID=2605694 RepID=UPI001E3C3CDD|nr:hypothetical protein [Roseiconus lacunae]MCD0461548.1 hypothetical protein [Roseiconus lacunae]